jgi:iron complex outermembrane receptor protein
VRPSRRNEKTARRLIAAGIPFLWTGTAFADVPVEEIVVESARPKTAPLALTIGETEIDRSRPVDLGDALERLTGLSLSTNSRGERLLSVRGRSERESAFVLAGVPLRDPWDGRLDLNLLPAGAIGALDLRPYGSPAYGSGGVVIVDFADGAGASALIEGGSGGYLRSDLDVAANGRAGSGSIHASAFTRDRQPAPDEAFLPFDREARGRLNTDREQASLLVQGEGMAGGWSAEGYVLRAQAAYGVAPEGHLDPRTEEVRAWRVPEDGRTIAALRIGTGTAARNLRLSAWHHRTDRRIDRYEDKAYAVIDGRERGADRETGGLLIASVSPRQGLDLSAGGSLAHARREETDRGEAQDFARLTYSLFAAGTASLPGEIGIDLAIRQEGFQTKQSGGRVEGPDLALTTANASIDLPLAGPFDLKLTAARIGRLPTQRELYGEALGRFLLNPSLEAETATALSASLMGSGRGWQFSVSPFFEDGEGAIDQESLIVDGVPRRRRINLRGTETLGFETAIRVDLAPDFSATARLMVLDLETDTGNPVPERPASNGLAELAYRPAAGFGGLIYAEHRGEAFSIDDGGGFARLPPATLLGAEVSHRFAAGQRQFETYLRLDNAFDEELLPQLGLPAPGRVIRFGVKLAAGNA